VAGTGCPGSTTEMLNNPFRIFVTTDRDLYVADHGNDRVQLFREGQRNGTSVAGNGSIGTIDLVRPSGGILDADEYLFIVHLGNHRIVGEDRNGFRCLVGCERMRGIQSTQSTRPSTISFDMDGNIFVTDWNNHRIQTFVFISDSCGKEKIQRRETEKVRERRRLSFELD
jgi:hypothetical protein